MALGETFLNKKVGYSSVVSQNEIILGQLVHCEEYRLILKKTELRYYTR